MSSAWMLAALTFTGVASAGDESSEKAAKYRDKMMDAAGYHMAALGMLVKGESSRKQDAVMHAAALHGLGKVVHELFPKGSGEAELGNRSKAEIWTDADAFKKAAKEFNVATEVLNKASMKGDMEAVRSAFQKVGGTCGGCHDAFRAEEK